MADKDPAFRGNVNLKPPDAVEYMSPDEYKLFAAEIVRCRHDINHYAENYFNIITQDKGKQIISLFPKQKELLKAFMENDRVVVLSSRQTSKCVTGDSMVKVRNKKTGVVTTMSIGDFHKMVAI